MNIYTTSFVVLMFVQVATAATSLSRKPKPEIQGQNCSSYSQIIDRCASMATYSFTTSYNPYPTSAIEMKASCDRIPDALKCIKTYSKCLKIVARRSLIAYQSSRTKHSKKICSNLNDSRAIDFWRMGECLKSSSGKKSAMVAKEKQLISTIQYLALNTTMKFEARLFTACCAASDYKIKAVREVEPDCTKYKGVMDDMLDSMVGELLEQACPDANRLETICAKLPKVQITKVWKAVSLTGAAVDLIVSLSEGSDDS